MNDTHACGLGNGVTGSGEPGIIVMDQDPDVRCIFLERPHHLPDLLGAPSTIRRGCHASQMAPSRAEFDEEENVQRLQPNGLYREEVAGQQLLPVVAH